MKYLYQNNYWEPNKNYNFDKLLYLMVDRPKYINKYNDFIWTNKKDQRHRDYDLPSYVYNINKTNVNLCWYKNNKQHKEKAKPAVIYYNGDKDYYINDKFIKEEVLKKNQYEISLYE